MVAEEITIRRATAADIPDLVRLRRMMFESMGCDDVAQLDAADEAAASYFVEAFPAEEFYGWLAVTPSGEAVGSGGAVFDQHPPGPTNLSGRIGYIMNVVTVPRHRRRGIARRMMRTMLTWLEEQGIQHAVLHTSDMGRSLYEGLGFVNGNEMRLSLRNI